MANLVNFLIEVSLLISRRLVSSRMEAQEEIMEQRREVIQELADLERDRDKKLINLKENHVKPSPG